MSSSLEPLRSEIAALKPDIIDVIDGRDSGAQLLRILTLNVAPADVATSEGGRVWELCGEYLFRRNRVHEALVLFLQLYDLKLAAQGTAGRVHKGSPLIWICHCFATLNFPVHARRYAMLSLGVKNCWFDSNVSLGANVADVCAQLIHSWRSSRSSANSLIDCLYQNA